jgi:uncharacterized protein (TIGR02186 family)
MKALRPLALALALLTISPAPAASQLAVDLSQHLVAVATDFTGTQLLLFGATEGEGDVIVVVRGPSVRRVVRRKERISGIWLNVDPMPFLYVPAFYGVAANRPIEEIAPPEVLEELQIGIDRLVIRGPDELPDAEVAEYRAALKRQMARVGLYREEGATIRFLGHLFRTTIKIPANAPVGSYQVYVFLFKGGQVASTTRTPLVISRVGFAANLYDLAHRHSLAYGVLAILIAAVAGWMANAIFRRI